MLSLRSLVGAALRGARRPEPQPQLDDPDAEDELEPEELDALKRDLAGELARVATPSNATSR